MKLISFLLTIHLCCSLTGFSQSTVEIDLNYGKKKLKLNQNYILVNASTIQIATLRFYMMNVILYSKGKEFRMSEPVKLVDVENKNQLVFNENIESIDSVSYLLGTTYEANTSGVLEGDLDPINGMYWAWNSGYINFKIEGLIVKNDKQTKFEYHLGGYEKPHATAQTTVFIPTKKSRKSISLDFESFMNQGINSNNTTILIPGKEAVDMMNQLSISLND